jgi:RNA polymerase sigma factor (sigma-70 family)
MEFEELLEDIDKKILYFCKRYNFWNKKEELLSESFICFKNCKERFNGNEEEFKFYFLKSLSNHFLNFYLRERKFENKFLIFDDFEKIEKEVEIDQELIYKLNEKLNEEEIFLLDLKIKGFNLKEISEKFYFSYEKIKDTWSVIKKKLNQRLNSRIEIRKNWDLKNKERIKILIEKWRNENPDYFKRWRKKILIILKNGEKKMKVILENIRKLKG